MKKVYSDTGPFAIIPAWVLRLQVSPTAIRLYCQLAYMAERQDGTSYPSRDYLAQHCHCTVRSIANALNELAKYGAVLIEQRRKAGTAELDTNKYTVIRRQPRTQPSLPQEPNDPTPQEPNDLVTRGFSNQSPVSSEDSENPPPPPLPLAAFKDAVTAYLAAPQNKKVTRLVDIGDSLGYERNGGFAAALSRDFKDLPPMKLVEAMVSGITAKGDPWAYVRRALDGETRRAAGWGKQETRPAEGAGGFVSVSEEEVRAAEEACATEDARPGQGPGF